MLSVQAEWVDESGASDAAPDLCGRFTPDEFAERLADEVTSGGLLNAEGSVTLRVTVYVR